MGKKPRRPAKGATTEPPKINDARDWKGRLIKPCPEGVHGQPPRPCTGYVEEPESNGVSVKVHYVDDPVRHEKLITLLSELLDDHRRAQRSKP